MMESANPRATCPICDKPPTTQNRPFCSVRCARIDLGRWLNGVYRIATDEEGDEAEEADLYRRDGKA